MTKTIMDLVAEAKAAVPAISADDAAAMLNSDNVLVVDVREAGEVAATGKIEGALHVSRGLLEFRADAGTPLHDPAFAKDKTIILYCGTGGRAALCGKALLELGFQDVRNLGGFEAWVKAGGKTEGA